MSETAEKSRAQTESRASRGLAPVHFWVDASTKDAWQALASRYGRSLKDEIVVAMARHAASPLPLPETVPLPVETPAPKRPRGRPKKNS